MTLVDSMIRMRGTTWVGAAVLALAACGSPRAVDDQPAPDRDPAPSVVRIDDTHYLGAPVTVKNLTVWPVHTDRVLEIGEFLTLSEAQAAGVADVRECGGGVGQNGIQQVRVNGVNVVDNWVDNPQAGEAGRSEEVELVDGAESVPPGTQEALDALTNGGGIDAEVLARLLENVNANVNGFGLGGATVGSILIENKGDLPILVCAGSLIRGGNQDRQIGADVVIAAGATVPVEAFCVEQGRWSGERAGVATNATFQAVDIVAAKGVRMNGQYVKAQSEVWSNVQILNASLANSAPLGDIAVPAGEYSVQDAGVTSFFANLEGLSAEVRGERQAYIDAVVAKFNESGDGSGETDRIVGFAYAVNGAVTTVRTFAHPRLLRGHLDAFAQAMAVEAHLAITAEGADTRRTATAEDVVALVRELESSADELHETSGLNRNFVRSSANGFASRCEVPADALGGKVGAAAVTITRDWTSK